MSTTPPRRPTGGGAILMLILLLVVVAGFVFWARSRHPPGSAHPAATGVPPTAPPRAIPPQH